jgi:hypothetical protein
MPTALYLILMVLIYFIFFFRGLFNALFTVGLYQDHGRIGKCLEGSDRGVIAVMFQRFLKGARKITNILSQDSRCPCRDSNRAPTEV